MKTILNVFFGIQLCLYCFPFRIYSQQTFIPLRYLAINAGNASPLFGCWEYKLCRAQDVTNLRNYIAAWQPDIIMISEVYMSGQLNDTMFYGPVLPAGYDGACHPSIDRTTGDTVAWNAPNSSHEHECIAWKTSRMQLIPGSEKSVFGRNDTYGFGNCNYDFTGFGMKLLLDGQDTITAAGVHPNSSDAQCRTYEINNYWSQLAQGNKVIIGGDWNSDDYNEILPPSNFQINFSKGNYWNIASFPNDYSAVYIWPVPDRHLDHAFSNFGLPCTTCGTYYGTTSLIYGAALGGYNGHPRADAGSGMDHRQILVDMKIPVLQASIHENNFDNIKIYPNPADDMLHIRNIPLSDNKIRINIFNVFGKIILSQTVEKQNIISIEVKNLPMGIYFIETGNYREKILIIR